jgi:hypothetical protein
MKFTFEGRRYFIEFQRAQKDVTIVRKKRNGEQQHNTIKSLHPFTTARLKERLGDALPNLIESATVGCLPSDKYSNELGRLYALRALTQVLTKKHGKSVHGSKDFKRALWRAYELRGQSDVIEGTVVKTEAVLPAQVIH